MRFTTCLVFSILTILFSLNISGAADVPASASAGQEIRIDCTAVEDDIFMYVPSRQEWQLDDEITFSDYPEWLSVLDDTIFGIPREAQDNVSFKMEYRDDYSTTVYRVHIDIQPVNDPPVITSDARGTATQGQYYYYRLTAEDPDNDELVYTFEDIPEWAAAKDGILAGTPPAGAAYGTFTALVSDGEFTARQQIHLDILPGNEDKDDVDAVYERLISSRFGFVIYPSPLDEEEKMVYFGFVWKGTSIRYSLSILDMDGNRVHRIEEDVWNPEKIVRTQALDMSRIDLEPGEYVAELRVLDKEKGMTLKSRKVINISG